MDNIEKIKYMERFFWDSPENKAWLECNLPTITLIYEPFWKYYQKEADEWLQEETEFEAWEKENKNKKENQK